jgi:transposase
MKVTTIGLDLAKNVSQVHGVNECGVAVLRKHAAPPNTRFVPVKSSEQQLVLSQQTARQSFVHARTFLPIQCGLLTQFGLVVPQGIRYLHERVPDLVEDGSNILPGRLRLLVKRLLDHLKNLDCHVRELERDIAINITPRRG